MEEAWRRGYWLIVWDCYPHTVASPLWFWAVYYDLVLPKLEKM